MFGRLAMGCANVRAGTRVLMLPVVLVLVLVLVLVQAEGKPVLYGKPTLSPGVVAIEGLGTVRHYPEP